MQEVPCSRVCVQGVCKACVKSKHVGVRSVRTWGCSKAFLGCVRAAQVRGAPTAHGLCVGVRECHGVGCVLCV